MRWWGLTGGGGAGGGDGDAGGNADAGGRDGQAGKAGAAPGGGAGGLGCPPEGGGSSAGSHRNDRQSGELNQQTDTSECLTRLLGFDGLGCVRMIEQIRQSVD